MRDYRFLKQVGLEWLPEALLSEYDTQAPPA